MNPQRIAIKFFVTPDPTEAVDLAPFTPLFHEFIQKASVPGLLIDVADYAHVPNGPGIILIGAGGAIAVAGAVLLGVAFAEKSALESPDGMPMWTPDEQSRADQVPILAGAGEIAIVVGVAALAVGVVLMVIDGGGGDSQASVEDGRFVVRF